MPENNIIVVGASAGGVEALAQLVCNLPSDLPAAIFIVLHIPAQGPSFLPNILNRSIQKSNRGSPLQASHPQDKEAIEHGRIYIAPPDRHLLIKEGYLHLVRGPRENSHRPAVDPLFRTAAKVYGNRVVGVVLSGTLDDGTAGLLAVKQRGGVAIVQNPDEALYSGMPKSAIENVEVDYILGVSEIAKVLVELANKPRDKEGVEAVSSNIEIESDIAELDLAVMQSPDRPGTPSPFGCPECGGVLWELHEGKLMRFRCRTGHAFSADTLLAEQSEALEEALWSSLRALEEKAALAQRMASQAGGRSRPISAQRFAEQAQDAHQQATLIRQILLKGNGQGNRKGELSTAQEQRREMGILPTLFPVVAIAVSSGRLNALSQVISALPADFPAAIVVVQHLQTQQSSQLAGILSQPINLKIKQAESGDKLLPGTVYITPTNQHLLVNPDSTISLANSELVHFERPSVDLLFESVAGSCKQQAIAVVLTQTDPGSDGAMGLKAIKKMGGRAITQKQANSEYSVSKPPIEPGSVDLVVALDEIAATLESLVKIKDRQS